MDVMTRQEYHKYYRKKNLKRLKEYEREYRKRNLETLRAKSRLRNMVCKEKYKPVKKAWYLKNRDRILAKQKEQRNQKILEEYGKE